MPRGDRTGPWGMGPMTGRAAGFCGGYGMPGYANPVPGRGFRMGFGRGAGSWGRGFGGGGRGWRHWYYATGMPGWMRFGGYGLPYPALDPDSEKQALRNEAEALQAELEEIKKRLAEVESEVEKSSEKP
jgi:ribosomal protein L15